MIQQNMEKIKEIIHEFFGKTGWDIEAIEIKDPQDSVIDINLKVEEPQVLIGERGQTLAEIQRLLKIIIQKKISSKEPFYINLDVNEYKKKKKEYLREVAKSVANEVILTKKEKQLPPMSSFERRIIHLELVDRSEVVTESIGQEPARQVIIKLRS